MKMKRLLPAIVALLGFTLGTTPIVMAKGKPTHQAKCPDTWDSNKCAYFSDGYKAGKTDRQANQSMAYERHSDQYDSRFEEAYRVGYEEGWQAKGKK
ncbi:MAG: hypothetical protein ACK443_03165 [Methylococcaceae bacterium]|jgi:hypothetical protein